MNRISVFLLCLLAAAAFVRGYASAQALSTAGKSGGIVIVPTLDNHRNVRQLSEGDFGGYIMVYFKDETQCAYMAVSRDGYTFTDLNRGEPIFNGELLAEQKGVRDPHMTRGPDGAFYLAMTETIAQSFS